MAFLCHDQNQGTLRPCQQGLRHGESAGCHAAGARLEAENGPLRQQTGLAPREFGAPDSQAANPIPVCSPVNNYGARRAVDERRFACGWTPGAVARIPQITSLDPGRPGVQAGLQPAARQTGAYRSAAWVSSYLE